MRSNEFTASQPSPATELRGWRADDLDVLVRAGRDELIQRFTSLPQPYEPHHAHAFLAAHVTDAPDAWSSAVVLDGRVLGCVSARPDPEQAFVLRLGWWLLPDGRGRGLATAVARAAGDRSFSVPGVERVDAWIEVDNVRSRAVADRAGLPLEAVLRRRVRHRGALRDVALHAAVRDDVMPPAPVTAPPTSRGVPRAHA